MKRKKLNPIVLEFEYLALQILSGPTSERETLLTALHAKPLYRRLPKYAKATIEAYEQGILDTEAKQSGRQISVRPRPMRLVTAVPPYVQRLQPDATWFRHPNGGGWVSNTADVADTAWVGRGAMVFDYARVLDRARLTGESMAHGHATLRGNAQLKGRALIRDWCILEDDVILQGEAMVGGTVHLAGSMVLGGSAELVGTMDLGGPKSDVVAKSGTEPSVVIPRARARAVH